MEQVTRRPTEYEWLSQFRDALFSNPEVEGVHPRTRKFLRRLLAEYDADADARRRRRQAAARRRR